MISGLESYIRDSQLATKVDLAGAVVGISGSNILAGVPVDTLAAAAEARNFKLVVVFDGPTRPTPPPVDSSAMAGLFAELKKRDIEYMIAPGLAAAQLAYMYRENFVTHIAAATECVLFGEAPLVIGLLTEPRVATYRALLQSTRLQPQQLTELGLAAGCALIPERCPLLDQSMNPIRAGLKAAQMGGSSVYRAAMQFDFEYATRLQTALAAVNWQPVLNTAGETVLSNPRGLPEPSDLRVLIGLRLPHEYYYYLSRGDVSAELLRGLVWGWLADDAENARGVATADYTALQKVLSPLRGQALDYLSSAINRYFQFSKTQDRSLGAGPLDRKRVSPLHSEALDTPEKVYDEVVAVAQKTAGAASVDELLQRAGVEPCPQLEASAALALRWLAEAVHVAIMATGGSREPIAVWPPALSK